MWRPKMTNNLREKLESRSIPEPNTGCWLWAGSLNGAGYGMLKNSRKKTEYRAHRLSWMINKGPIPNGMCVLHRCDVRCCVNPDHLFIGTHLDNMADRTAKGRDILCRNINIRGEKHGKSKLTEKQVTEILASRKPKTILATLYGVNYSTIWRIQNHEHWNHILAQE